MSWSHLRPRESQRKSKGESTAGHVEDPSSSDCSGDSISTSRRHKGRPQFRDFVRFMKEAVGGDGRGFQKRVPFTCSHRVDDEVARQLEASMKDGEEIKTIERFYVEAARRLPLVQMPELVDCIHTAGHCIGLADPVSNIILNAISRLPSPGGGLELSPPPESSHSITSCESDWMVVAYASNFALVSFMVAYFRYLTDTQARRYLFLASYDLPLAIKLVQHDRLSYISLLPSPHDFGKLKAALRIAAVTAGHPAPDDLAGLMTMQYPSNLLSPVMTKLLGGELLSTNDVWDIKDLLGHQWPPTSAFNLEFVRRHSGNACTQGIKDNILQVSGFIGEGIFARVSIERYGRLSSPQMGYISNTDCAYMKAKHQKFLLENTVRSHYKPVSVENYDAVPCDHIKSLKMCLLDAIHAIYIKALAILPSSAWGPRFLRALLVAGHCYGPLDPLGNIILNSIWFDITFPLCEAHEQDRSEVQGGILDISSMARIESRSLNGLLALLHATSKTPFSEHEALEYLYFWNCYLPIFYTEKRPAFIPFDAVAKAAKHPQYAAFGSFLMSMPPETLHHLHCVLPPTAGERISHTLWDQLVAIAREGSLPNSLLSTRTYEAPCYLLPEASLEISRKKSDFRDKLTFVRTELNKILLKYCIQHPWEPSYQLDIICGVLVRSTPYCEHKLFHANFLASSDGAAVPCERTLFFAEFESPSSEGPSSTNCSPVHDYRSHTGRCSVCENEASKILHPPSTNDPNGSISLYNSLYRSAVHRVCTKGFEGLIESDYIYYDGDRDFELRNILNDSCKTIQSKSRRLAGC